MTLWKKVVLTVLLVGGLVTPAARALGWPPKVSLGASLLVGLLVGAI